MDPDLRWERLGLRDSPHEVFRVFGPRLLESALTLGEHLTGPVVMDISRGEHRDPAVAMLMVVPREEGSAEVDRRADVGEAPGEVGVVLDDLEVRLRQGVVVTDPGAAERAGDPDPR